jgi:hypothetical protein
VTSVVCLRGAGPLGRWRITKASAKPAGEG